MLNTFLFGGAVGLIIGIGIGSKVSQARRRLARKVSRAIRGGR
jgi:hypothetical protein